MTLSICMITRDAEASLERVLGSIADLKAEVIVLDTGSKDQTVQKARSLGANASVIPWQDDFAAAQNLALAQARGDWIFWINPDEELLPPGPQQILQLLARPDALAYAVRVKEVMKPQQVEQATETYLPRLFRRHRAIQFVGRLHPHFEPPLEELARRENLRIYPTNVVLRHHAYQSTVTPEKVRWANRLLELELRDRPGQLHYLITYGRNLLELNDPKGHEVLAEASEQVRAASAAPAAPTATVASLLEYLLTVSPDHSRSGILPTEARDLAQRWFPVSPPLLWAMAQGAFKAERFSEAVPILERLVHLGRTGAYDRSAAFDPNIMGEPALLNLANCYLRLRDFDRAELCFAQVFSSPRHQAQARQGYARAQEMRREVPANTNS